MKYRLLLIFALLASVLGMQAQILEPVKWQFSSEKINGSEYMLTFTAHIDPQWHLYSQDIPMSPPATTFTFEKSKDYELEGKVAEKSKIIEEYDSNFDMTLKYFADTAVFQQRVKLLVAGETTVKGSLEYMSCNDKQCLPPQDVNYTFRLKSDLGKKKESKILEPVKWDFIAKKTGSKTFDLYFKAHIDKGYHLYSMHIPENGPLPTVFDFQKSSSYELVGNTVEVTKPVEKYDKVFEMEIGFFNNNAVFKQSIKLKSDKKEIPVTGEISYMSCNDVGCVALYTDYDFHFNGKKDVALAETGGKQDKKAVTTVTTVSDTRHQGIDITGNKKSLWAFFLLSFLGGLIAIVTPCVFPMIPMTVSFFMREDEEKAKGKIQALFYGLSIILVYTFIGSVLAVIAGPNIANWISTHWLPNILFFLIFTIFAFSFFGMFEITLPHWMVNKTEQKADNGGFLGPLFMALTLVLVSFSCTGPIVGTILVESAGGEILKPIIGMLGFSLAFAMPFTLFAFFPSWLAGLPKSGGWLNSVKVVLGFLELALGLKFLSIADQTYHWHILDREVYIALWVVIFFLMGLYLLGKLKFVHDPDVPYITVPRLVLSIITFAFVVYMIPGMFGAPLKILSGYLPPQSTIDFDMNKIVRENLKTFANFGTAGENKEICGTPKYHEFLSLPQGLEGYFDYKQALACAKELNKPLFIDFTGHGCVNCREMEAVVWADPKVLKRLRNDYIVVALYVDDKYKLPKDEWVKSTYDGRIKKTIGKKFADFQISKFGVNAQPFYVLMGTHGDVLVQPRAYNLNIDAFVKFLDKGLKNFKEGKSVFNINKK